MVDFKPKLIIFDLNKTLIAENTWHDLNMAMGVTPEEDRMFMDWYEEGIITYEEGQKFLSNIYRERGKATKKRMEEIIGKYEYHEGAEETTKYLAEKGYKLAIVTGSIDVLAEKVAQELGIEIYAAHNRLEFDGEGKFVRISCVGDDADFKLGQLVQYCHELNIKQTEVMCVGDGYNDEKMFIACGHGVAFRGSKIDRSSWGVIDGLEDLKTLF